MRFTLTVACEGDVAAVARIGRCDAWAVSVLREVNGEAPPRGCVAVCGEVEGRFVMVELSPREARRLAKDLFHAVGAARSNVGPFRSGA